MKSELLISAAVCSLAVLFAAGCRQSDVSAAERADRASRMYSAAMAELQAGRVDSAINGFQSVVKAEPGNGNAHFQLAALLEDVKKDYLGAMIHYRLYCMIRPDSEKAAVAIDRMKGCEMRYAADALTKAGLENRLSAELEALRAEHSGCRGKLSRLSEELSEARRKIVALEKASELKSRMLEKAKGVADDSSVSAAPRKNLRPTDAQLLDGEDEGGARISSKEIKDLKAMLDEDERNAKPSAMDAGAGSGNTQKASPLAGMFAPGDADKGKKSKEVRRVIPETYIVEEGDTLMRISVKFYGTNRRWRDIREANKTVISSDGRVRAGQEIKLP